MEREEAGSNISEWSRRWGLGGLNSSSASSSDTQKAKVSEVSHLCPKSLSSTCYSLSVLSEQTTSSRTLEQSHTQQHGASQRHTVAWVHLRKVQNKQSRLPAVEASRGSPVGRQGWKELLRGFRGTANVSVPGCLATLMRSFRGRSRSWILRACALLCQNFAQLKVNLKK